MRGKTRSGRLRFDERLGLPVDPLPSGIPDPLAPKGSKADGRGGENGLFPAMALVAVIFAIVVGRLVQLQIVRGDSYYQRSTDNFIKERDLPSVRGQIRDRKGRVLVENRPAYSVFVTPQFVNDTVLGKLGRYLEWSEERQEAMRTRLRSRTSPKERSQALLLEEDITRDQMALLESQKLELHGVDMLARSHRTYPHGMLLSHLLGYLNQVGPVELGHGYKSGDYIGRAGLERQLETELRGVPGYEKVIVDAHGRRKSERELLELKPLLPDELRREPVPGSHVVLTIDLELQRIVERALKKHHSAAAALVEVESGRVLALASYPAPDPNLLTGRLSRAEAERLASDPLRPLADKAVREAFFPGSTFKVVPALAALEEHLVNPDEKVRCGGSYKLGRHTFRCMKSHGPVNMQEAIAQSCNVYFYHLAEKVGLERMAKVAAEFGFGTPTGIGLGEAPGFMPTLEYFKKNGGFRSGYTMNTALGQGAVRVTVLQLALAYAALGNGGRLYQPLLIERIEKPSGEVLQQNQPVLRGLVTASPESLERLRKALVDVVANPKGTAYTAYEGDFDVAGKSGTAQVRKNRRGEAAGWDLGNDHAWFVGFSPSRHARVAVAVLAEHGGLGGHVAAPTAIEILRGYFEQAASDEAAAHKPSAESAPPAVPPADKRGPT